MYFIIYIFLTIIIFSVLLYNLVKLVIEPNFNNKKKLINVAVYIIAIATLINILIAAYSFFLTKDKIAIPGDRGIKGPKGQTGRNGICESKCGQKVCYISVIEHANKIFNKRLQKINPNHSYTEIKNEYLKNKINEICSSDKYYNIITQKLKQKPTEKKLIEYLKKIIEEWIILFLKYNPDNNEDVNNYLGVKFLLEKNYTPDIIINPKYNKNLDTQPSPFEFIEKYDIFNWGEKDYYSQKKIVIESNNLTFPEANVPKLYIMKTNNYERVYTSKMKPSLWDTTQCNYNQMGNDKTNPNNLKKCIYINPNNKLKEYKNTWKTHSYVESTPLSLYNVKPFKTKNNQIFYPVGSVWSGKYENDYKNKYSKRLPKSKNFCGEGHGLNKTLNHSNRGPEKETILVSGDVKDPDDFELIWDSTRGCKDCQESNNNIKIFRPIPPKGYVALGDVAAVDKEHAKSLNIKCLPKFMLTEMSIGPMVWKNQDMVYSKFSNYENYTKNRPTTFKKQISMTLWSAGSNNVFEENKNNPNIDLEDDGGYNLFRITAGKGYNKKPEFNSYKIKNKYLQRGNGKNPKKLKLKMDNIDQPIKRFNDEIYFGKKPQNAVITNIQKIDNNEKNKSVKDFEDKPKRLYLVDDGNKRDNNKSDTFFIKTHNSKTNDFSSCLVTRSDNKGNGFVDISNTCDKTNPSHTWNIKHNMNNTSTQSAPTNIQSAAKFENETGVLGTKCLYHHFDTLGKDVYTLENCSNKNFQYDTFIADELPLYLD